MAVNAPEMPQDLPTGTQAIGIPLDPPAVPAKAAPGFPLVTTILLIIIAAVYVGELLFDGGPWTTPFAPSVRTLVSFGGLQYSLVVQQGQWYRLLTSPLLHADAFHLVNNGISLFVGAMIVEYNAGRLWCAALFILGGVAGGLMSLLLDAHNVVMVGASGAIIALFAAVVVFSLHRPGNRARLLRGTLFLLAAAFLPQAHSLHGELTDYAAHLGGLMAGASVAGLLLPLWRQDQAHPPLKPVAAAIVAVTLVALCWSIPNLSPLQRVFGAIELIPAAQLEGDVEDHVAAAQTLLRKYPQDPRSYLYAAMADMHAHDLKAAENHVRTGLAQDAALESLDPTLKTHLEGYLALILNAEDRVAEARAMARSGCLDQRAKLHEDLVKANLCFR